MTAEQTRSKSAVVCVDGERAGLLTEHEKGRSYAFVYDKNYQGQGVSLTMPPRSDPYHFPFFPPFFDGLLPEGVQLVALLRHRKIDKDDVWSQLLAVGSDLVGNVTVIPEETAETS